MLSRLHARRKTAVTRWTTGSKAYNPAGPEPHMLAPAFGQPFVATKHRACNCTLRVGVCECAKQVQVTKILRKQALEGSMKSALWRLDGYG